MSIIHVLSEGDLSEKERKVGEGNLPATWEIYGSSRETGSAVGESAIDERS